VTNPGGALEDLAGGLRAKASLLRTAAEEPVRSHEGSGWTGRRSEQLRQHLLQRRHELQEQADELARLAGTVDHLAQEYRERIRQMKGIENRVRGWIHAATQEELHLLGWTVTQLPPPGDPRWITVLARARSAGAGL
jgi:capsid protein